MELVYLIDRSEQNIDKMLRGLNPGEHREKISTILSKAKNLYLLYHERQLCGFINIKPNPAKGVFYCPLYYVGDASFFIPGDIAGQITQLFPETKATYCVYMNFLGMDYSAMWAAHKPYDMSMGMRLDAKAMRSEPHLPAQAVCVSEDIAHKELLTLHLQAYASEPEYVLGEWDELLEQFYTYPSHTIVTCRLQGELIGACLGYQKEAEHYIYSVCLLPKHQGRGMGRYMLESYLMLTQYPVYSLSVMTNNLAAKQLYEKLGFSETCENYTVYKL